MTYIEYCQAHAVMPFRYYIFFSVYNNLIIMAIYLYYLGPFLYNNNIWVFDLTLRAHIGVRQPGPTSRAHFP